MKFMIINDTLYHVTLSISYRAIGDTRKCAVSSTLLREKLFGAVMRDTVRTAAKGV
jgi:hypothetical protein